MPPKQFRVKSLAIPKKASESLDEPLEALLEEMLDNGYVLENGSPFICGGRVYLVGILMEEPTFDEDDDVEDLADSWEEALKDSKVKPESGKTFPFLVEALTFVDIHIDHEPSAALDTKLQEIADRHFGKEPYSEIQMVQSDIETFLSAHTLQCDNKDCVFYISFRKVKKVLKNLLSRVAN